MREKGGNRFIPGPDYMVDALKLLNQTLPEFLASHYRRVWPGVVLMEHNTSFVGQFWPFQLLIILTNGQVMRTTPELLAFTSHHWVDVSTSTDLKYITPYMEDFQQHQAQTHETPVTSPLP
ncbi:hypothetical protein TNCV_5103811 [Trichonephila clavipes]|nr:hypothetical protein TNCV_5103811 [Trichonephila clavipes]